MMHISPALNISAGINQPVNWICLRAGRIYLTTLSQTLMSININPPNMNAAKMDIKGYITSFIGINITTSPITNNIIVEERAYIKAICLYIPIPCKNIGLLTGSVFALKYALKRRKIGQRHNTP